MAKQKDVTQIRVRVPNELKADIENSLELRGIDSLNEYVLNALYFYEELNSFSDLSDESNLASLDLIRSRDAEVVKWSEKLNVTRYRLLLNALDYYLDSLNVTSGRPYAVDLLTLVTSMQSVLGQMARVESKVDSLSRISVNGFNSFSRMTSGASYLLSQVDDGKLPEDVVDMNR